MSGANIQPLAHNARSYLRGTWSNVTNTKVPLSYRQNLKFGQNANIDSLSELNIDVIRIRWIIQLYTEQI